MTSEQQLLKRFHSAFEWMAKSLEESSEKHAKEMNKALSKQRQELNFQHQGDVKRAREEGIRIGREEERRKNVTSNVVSGAVTDDDGVEGTALKSRTMLDDEVIVMKQDAYDQGYVKAKQDMEHNTGVESSNSMRLLRLKHEEEMKTMTRQSYQEGYSNGVIVGKAEGIKETQEEKKSMQQGMEFRGEEGHLDKSSSELIDVKNKAYEHGYETGYVKGKEDGWGKGESDGMREGMSIGKKKGYKEGYDEGVVKGFSNGYDHSQAEVKEEYSIKLMKCQEEYNEKVKLLKEENILLISNTEKDFNQLKQLNNNKISNLELKIETLTKNSNETINKLIIDHENEINKLNIENDNYIHKLKFEHKEFCISKILENDEQIKSINNIHDESVEMLKNEYIVKMDILKNEEMNKINNIQNKLNIEIELRNEENRENSNKISDLKERLQHAQMNLEKVSLCIYKHLDRHINIYMYFMFVSCSYLYLISFGFSDCFSTVFCCGNFVFVFLLVFFQLISPF